MSDYQNTPYVPYGAFELKAKYQRHFLYSNFLVAAFVALILVAFHLAGTLEGAEPPPDPPPPDTRGPIEWEPPPPIDRSGPEVGDGAQEVTAGVGIPEPVADELIVDDSVTLATRDELALLNGPDIGDGEGKRPVIMDLSEEMVPNIDSFIPVEVEAERVYFEMPVYPRLAEQAGIEGTVWIKALVLKDGTVKEAVVYKSSETESLDEAAVNAAMKCRFKPAVQSGRPVAVWVAWPYHFRLTE